MTKVEIERFFHDFGTEIDTGNELLDPLYTPLQGEKVFVADWGNSLAQRQQRVYFIRGRAGDQQAIIRATTVVLRPDTLLCFDAWRNTKPDAELKEKGRDMNVDVTELAYTDVLALKLRCKALRVEEVIEMGMF